MTPEYKYHTDGNAVIHIATGTTITLPAGEAFGFAYEAYVAEGGITAPTDVPDHQAALTRVVQQHLDATAQSLGYDDIRSAATYADEPAVAKFQNEGRALRAWRSLVWAAAYDKMQRVKLGVEPVPIAEVLVASLPAFTPP